MAGPRAKDPGCNCVLEKRKPQWITSCVCIQVWLSCDPGFWHKTWRWCDAKAHICIRGGGGCIDRELLQVSRLRASPGCAEVCPGLLGTCQLLALSVGCVTGVCEVGGNKMTAMLPGWAMSSEAHAGHLQWILCYRSEVKRRERCKPQCCFLFLWPQRPAVHPLVWLPVFHPGKNHLPEWSCILSASLDPRRVTEFNPLKRTLRESRLTWKGRRLI